MRHNYDHEGRCYYCKRRWSETVGTKCEGWLTPSKEQDSVLDVAQGPEPARSWEQDLKWTSVPQGSLRSRYDRPAFGPVVRTKDRPRSP